MRKVITFGTFDIFHPGHISYLKQAKELEGYLVTVVAKDQTVKKNKGKWPVNNEKRRLEIVRKSQLVDETTLGQLKDKYAVIRKYRPDVIALGYDQKTNIAELKNKLIEFNLKAEIIRLKAYHPEIYKSSKLKKL